MVSPEFREADKAGGAITRHLESTHFLHSLFGMHGTVEVMP
jgi:hypothetical protein